MNTTIILRRDEYKARAAAIIAALPIDPVHEIVVREHRRNRSLDQNQLLWKWQTIIGAELGITKEEVHEEYKSRYLVPILTRDDADYAAMMQTVEDVRLAGMEKEAAMLERQIVGLTSTARLNTKQFTEYLDDIAHHAAGIGIALPHPEDRGRG